MFSKPVVTLSPKRVQGLVEDVPGDDSTSPTSLEITDYVYFGGKRVAQLSNDLNLNGGFESGLTNWSASGSGTASAVNNSASAHSGGYYADIAVPPGGSITSLVTTQPISAQKGETINASGWVYREVGGQQYSRWFLNVTGSNGSAVGQPPDNTTMNAWVYETMSVTVPSWLEGPYTVTVGAQVSSTSSTQSTTARFDDATLNGSNLLFAEDSLGTTRVVTDTSGVVCYDADFYPYGGERPYTNTCTTHYKFEGKERDAETGNDAFGARYYSNRFGRWLSADWSNVPVPIPYANLRNPQSLNLYSMVGNDPESFADLDGHCCLDCPPSERASCLGHAPENIRETELGKLADDQLAEQAAAEQQNKQQTGTLIILGQSVPYTIAPMGQQQAADALAQVNAAVAAINAAQAQLTQEQITDIKAVTAVYIVPTMSYAGGNAAGLSVTTKDVQKTVQHDLKIKAEIGTFVINASNLLKVSSSYWASTFVHEGVHIINRDVSTEFTERRAYAAQYRAAPAFHLLPHELQFVKLKCGASCE